MQHEPTSKRHHSCQYKTPIALSTSHGCLMFDKAHPTTSDLPNMFVCRQYLWSVHRYSIVVHIIASLPKITSLGRVPQVVTAWVTDVSSLGIIRWGMTIRYLYTKLTYIFLSLKLMRYSIIFLARKSAISVIVYCWLLLKKLLLIDFHRYITEVIHFSRAKSNCWT